MAGNTPDLSHVQVTQLALDTVTIKRLQNHGFDTVGDIQSYEQEEHGRLQDLDGIGDRTQEAIHQAIEGFATGSAEADDEVENGAETSPADDDDNEAEKNETREGEAGEESADTEPAGETPLPKDFPCRNELIRAGYRTVQQVAKIRDPAKIRGVTNYDLNAIRVRAGWSA